MTSFTDGLGRITRTERTVTSAGLVATESVDASYDPAGRILSMSLQGGAATHSFTYDTLGRLVAANAPDIGPRTLVYNDHGWLLEHHNGENQAVHFSYDDAGRMIARWNPDTGDSFTYHHDVQRDGTTGGGVLGRLGWVDEPEGAVELTYDARGRLLAVKREIRGKTASETNTLTPSGLVLSVSHDDDFTANVDYDRAGRAVSVRNGGITLWSATTLDASGNVMDAQFGNGVTQRFERDALRQPTRIELLRGDGVTPYEETVPGLIFPSLVESGRNPEPLGADNTRMTAPRRVLPGHTYLITRRCTQRQFLLRPSKQVNEIIRYVAAYAALRSGVRLHAVCALSNHYHIVATDPDARLPEFMATLNKLTAKCINASYGRWENLWASQPPSAVRLVSAKDVLSKVAYTLCNPVSSFLVARGDQWPGVRLSWLDGHRLVERPRVFFRPEGAMPEYIKVELHPPPGFEEVTPQRLASTVRRLLDRRDAYFRNKAKRMRVRFLGAARVLRQRPTAAPRTVEPRRRMSPRIASRDKWRRVEALARLRVFLDRYRHAWAQWRLGVRDVVFPSGTYAMRVHQGVACETG